MGRMGRASGLDRRTTFLGSQALMSPGPGCAPGFQANEGTLMRDTASWIAIGAALTSAWLGLYASAGSDLRDRVEKLVPQIRRDSPWAAWAAIAAAVSVVAQAMEMLPA